MMCIYCGLIFFSSSIFGGFIDERQTALTCSIKYQKSIIGNNRGNQQKETEIEKISTPQTAKIVVYLSTVCESLTKYQLLSS